MMDGLFKTITHRMDASLEKATLDAARNEFTPRLRVLLVEDQEDTRRLMGALLIMLGYLVVSAGTVKEALELADHDRFQLLVCGIGLPDGTGMDVIQQIQARYPIKGIAVTGFTGSEIRRQSHEAGFEAHLPKPIELTKLSDIIRGLVG
jgi:CheY-like chemotaxis protein